MVRNWMQRWWRKKAEPMNGRWETDGNYMLKDILRFKAWGKESKNMADGKVSCLPNGLLMLCWTHTNMQMYKVSKQSQHKHLYGIKKFCKTNLFFSFLHKNNNRISTFLPKLQYSLFPNLWTFLCVYGQMILLRCISTSHTNICIRSCVATLEPYILN